ncbi:protein-methionine-sulfoxide reductase heme-binding subunit MsrQ [Vineibacter terrae]|uniref:sulfite oxidase heme-binding subunit YedZ n=1 Tax=Vineibacter terrae TaxID=2586908 RepID=UPI002E371BB8|nr:protein-methionine-sulfoxide reductase heme-binding subunit MsrQ [Vineibacter terrae]HEX2890727.1 protein-methionine-sulfoxide reductase heme-binding subunit MsrQ [Vineibacter terrae]
MTTRRRLPWQDPAGRFSPFKLAVFVLLFVPAIVIAARYESGELGARPVNEAVHQIGNWTLKLILISLAISPGRAILKWPRLMQVRRMVGVAAFAYAAIHLTLYAADEAFDLRKVGLEIVLRIYLTIGFMALLILAALAVTSTDGMMRRLGGPRWRRLHRLVYVAALLGVVHFFMQTKANAAEPYVMAGLLAWLMGWRLLAWRGLRDARWARWWAMILAMLAAAGTAVGEAVYFWIRLGVPPSRLLAANITFTAGIRPAVVVFAICMAAALAGVLRPPAAARVSPAAD